MSDPEFIDCDKLVPESDVAPALFMVTSPLSFDW